MLTRIVNSNRQVDAGNCVILCEQSGKNDFILPKASVRIQKLLNLSTYHKIHYHRKEDNNYT